MKRAACLLVTLVFGLAAAGSVLAFDRQNIEHNVNGIVESLDKGTNPESINPNDVSPYAFIMEQDGTLLVHPDLAGESLKAAAEPVYKALIDATPEGTWVDYVWKEKQKHSYVRTTQSGLIVGSGYTE